MRIEPISQTNFNAGSVKLRNINIEGLYTYDAIKKIAENRDIDISIAKNKKSKYLPLEDLYTVVTSKFVKNKGFFTTGGKMFLGTGCAIMSKDASKEETSVKIFNAVIKAIECLNSKLKIQ